MEAFNPELRHEAGSGFFMAKIMSSPKFILISFTGSCEPTHLLTIEILSDYALFLKTMVSLALNYVGFTRGEGSTAVASVYRTLKQVMLNVRVFVTEKTEVTDFIQPSDSVGSSKPRFTGAMVDKPRIHFERKRRFSDYRR
ncbi:hypothetical protein [Methylomonas methanica]|uniref:Uncharacterized protein n=1 Tax=Methylomonas methanica TaxID=421 RepID=A0A177MKG1_METMH|nr:hypothetical protein [Methylomonas methanica]OAI06286.1 hypothetical protein A1332_11755 [Methylomonas methanica]